MQSSTVHYSTVLLVYALQVSGLVLVRTIFRASNLYYCLTSFRVIQAYLLNFLSGVIHLCLCHYFTAVLVVELLELPSLEVVRAFISFLPMDLNILIDGTSTLGTIGGSISFLAMDLNTC